MIWNKLLQIPSCIDLSPWWRKYVKDLLSLSDSILRSLLPFTIVPCSVCRRPGINYSPSHINKNHLQLFVVQILYWYMIYLLNGDGLYHTCTSWGNLWIFKYWDISSIRIVLLWMVSVNVLDNNTMSFRDGADDLKFSFQWLPMHIFDKYPLSNNT